MPSHLSDIKFIDMNTSVMDDGTLTAERVKLGELKTQSKVLSRDKTKNVAELEKLRKAIAAQDKVVKAAQVEYAKTLKQARTNGVFKFKTKRFVDYYGIRGSRPKHYLKFQRFTSTNGYREYNTCLATGWSDVKPDTDPYWAEGVFPNPNGQFIFGDAILMKQDLRRYLVDQIENQQRANRAPQEEISRFKAKVESEGGMVPQDEIDSMMEQLKKSGSFT